MLGVVFRKAQNDSEQWMSLDARREGDAYERAARENAADTSPALGGTSRRGH